MWLIHDDVLYFFMYKVPRYYFEVLLASGNDVVDRGNSRWANFTDGDVDGYFNTDCYWSDADCGMSGDSCYEDDMVVG